jgi:hypothetical protein
MRLRRLAWSNTLVRTTCNILQSGRSEPRDGDTVARARPAGTTRFCKTIDTLTSKPTNDGSLNGVSNARSPYSP